MVRYAAARTACDGFGLVVVHALHHGFKVDVFYGRVLLELLAQCVSLPVAQVARVDDVVAVQPMAAQGFCIRQRAGLARRYQRLDVGHAVLEGAGGVDEVLKISRPGSVVFDQQNQV